MTEPITAADIDRLHAVALLDLAADENAQRCYRVATVGDLYSWLSPVPNGQFADTWLVRRRVDLMRRELAKRQAERCMSTDHFGRFGDDAAQDVAGHVAKHLRLLRGV
jgi:hypothetical protein